MKTKSESKIACTLSPDQLQKQRGKLLPGLLKRADSVSDLSGDVDGIRLQFKQQSGLLAELAGIIEREQACCSFLSFNITVESAGGAVTFDVSGPAGTRDFLKSLLKQIET